MKKVIVFLGVVMLFGLTSCHRNGCPNQIEADHVNDLEVVD